MEVISRIPHYASSEMLTLIIILLTIFIFWCVMKGFEVANEGKHSPIPFVILTIVSIFSLVVSYSAMKSEETIDYYLYEVTLKDITAREFLENYEIVAQDGEIYTIKEIDE